MKKLKPIEVALIVFAAICIFGSQFLEFLSVSLSIFYDMKIVGIVSVVLFSLFFAIYIGLQCFALIYQPKYDKKIPTN